MNLLEMSRRVGSPRESITPLSPPEPDMAKFIQICASQDDLFALDEEGHVYQYNFNMKAWTKLAPSRAQEGLT